MVSKSLNIVKVLSRTEWGADRTTLLKLYRSLVISKLDYDCIIYRSASKTALAKLDPVHYQGLHLSLGALERQQRQPLSQFFHQRWLPEVYLSPHSQGCKLRLARLQFASLSRAGIPLPWLVCSSSQLSHFPTFLSRCLWFSSSCFLALTCSLSFSSLSWHAAWERLTVDLRYAVTGIFSGRQLTGS